MHDDVIIVSQHEKKQKKRNRDIQSDISIEFTATATQQLLHK